MKATPGKAPRARRDQMEHFLREVDGVPLEICVLRAPDVMALLLSGRRSDGLTTVVSWFAQTARAPAGTGPLCMLCETEFSRATMPEAICCIWPFARRPAAAMATGICRQCFGRVDQKALLTHYRKIWPDAYFERVVGTVQ